MKTRQLLTSFLVLTILFSCKTSSNQTLSQNKTTSFKSLITPLNEYSVSSVLWQQNAAEYKALTYQAYNLAKIQLVIISVKKSDYDKPLAIVTDIDETVLDNSAFNGKMIELNEAYSDSRWVEWGKEQKATLIPGAADFLTFATEHGFEIFYISNRLSTQKDETLANLKKFNLPFADEKHLLLKENTSGKESRRKQVEQTHEIIMLIGDNLSDFSSVFDKKPTKERNQLTDSLKTAFGTKYIILPNPMYGDWETKGILEGKYNWTPTQKDSIRKSKIRTY